MQTRIVIKRPKKETLSKRILRTYEIIWRQAGNFNDVTSASDSSRLFLWRLHECRAPGKL